MVSFDAEWLRTQGEEEIARYGIGSYVAVFEEAIIDWGVDPEEVRERAAAAIGEPVYMGAVASIEPGDSFDFDPQSEATAKYLRLRPEPRFRRRVTRFGHWDTMLKLGLVGPKLEFYGGRWIEGGNERRWSDFDYRLMVEHGIVSADTILVAGIIFWKVGVRVPE